MASAPSTQSQAQTSPDSKPPRVALVTGAAQGLGEGIARRFADDGLDVALADLPTKREQLEAVAQAVRASGRRALVLVGDVTQEAAVARAFDAAKAAFGRVDVVFNNAGVALVGEIEGTPVDLARRVFDVNFLGRGAREQGRRALLPRGEPHRGRGAAHHDELGGGHQACRRRAVLHRVQIR